MIYIRKAVPYDAKGITKVHVESWKSTYVNIVPEEFLNNLSFERRADYWFSVIPDGGVYVAEDENNQIVGFASGGKERSGDYSNYNGEIYAIYILKEYQGIGIGKLLIDSIVKELTNQGVFTMLVLVLEDNPSRHFYEKLGAKKIDSIIVEIGGVKLNELVYGWEDIMPLAAK
ncbi:GNAT family N-acetyltransferase [Psychrobacillus sp. FSL W7-1457]|uniref:GNAT family N-acetyltransferase n=1 Tax=unclassified Psychrobacillus TaxID=2636677 RepID=UPI0030F5B052